MTPLIFYTEKLELNDYVLIEEEDIQIIQEVADDCSVF